ncbi:MAG: alkaline phosphatase family protein [Firmicutes bacterium]|jgi:predicted AlkP superfamily pyrophosphatase or phosphodiesterase|nr:alkaline phosphatase family protein [Bacillota bacterium]MDH7495288.1 alkaline phosphatase family protein [Bacillota bacterium]
MTSQWLKGLYRAFLVLTACFLAAAATAAASGGPGDQTRAVVALVILDGCPAQSLDALPPEAFLRRMASTGLYQHVKTVFPSSTAAGHAAILTGKWPEENGITGKQFVGEDGELSGFSSPSLLEARTIIQRAAELGIRTALVSGKEGVRTLFCEGADLAASPATAPPWVLETVGPPPDESAQYEDYCGWYEKLDGWVVDVACAFAKDAGPSSFIVLNLAGPDKVGHRCGPVPARETTRCLVAAGEALERLTATLEEVAGTNWAVVVTADHGMTYVDKAITPADLLDGFDEADCVYSLDGGVMGVWPAATKQDAVVAALKGAEGVLGVITTSSAERASLHAGHPRSAPIIAIAERGYMFIESAAFMEYTKGSHGALLDTDVTVPLIVYGPQAGRVDLSKVRDTVEIAAVTAELLGGLGD